MLRFITAGESHGPGLTTVVEGLPAGLEVTVGGIGGELARRRLGYGRGARMAIEQDELEILGGVRFGRTLGGPVSVVIRNTEWPKWRQQMDPAPGERGKRERRPRPGHADLAGMLKYDTHDARDILERASARETAARTVVGYLSKQVLDVLGVTVMSHVTAIGDVVVDGTIKPGPEDIMRIDASPVRVADAGVEPAMIAAVEAAQAAKDTLGGSVEVLVHDVPAGLGSHVHWDRKLDGRLAGALMSIPAIKAVEIGDGITQSRSPGTQAHDEIIHDAGRFDRRSNHAGGLEGGITNGDVVRVTAYMKPIATVMQPLDTVDVDTKEAAKAFRERSDVCAVPAAGVVAEQMAAFVFADEALRTYGGDTIDDLRRAHAAVVDRIERF
ncbi:MAG: chorismate synthase [Acidimicrobiia bacterium]|nr:chorismate synthase [Acidimicrobiia bacterium]